jgi:hypothetical protein
MLSAREWSAIWRLSMERRAAGRAASGEFGPPQTLCLPVERQLNLLPVGDFDDKTSSRRVQTAIELCE